VAASISRAPLLVGSGPQWTSAHVRWSGILVGAIGVLVAAMRDPAARAYACGGRVSRRSTVSSSS
jgi:hypothetical protein